MTIVGDICFSSVVVNLPTESIIFILASEVDSLESLEHDLYAFCRFRKHRLYWDTYFYLAMIL